MPWMISPKNTAFVLKYIYFLSDAPKLNFIDRSGPNNNGNIGFDLSPDRWLVEGPLVPLEGAIDSIYARR